MLAEKLVNREPCQSPPLNPFNSITHGTATQLTILSAYSHCPSTRRILFIRKYREPAEWRLELVAVNLMVEH